MLPNINDYPDDLPASAPSPTPRFNQSSQTPGRNPVGDLVAAKNAVNSAYNTYANNPWSPGRWVGEVVGRAASLPGYAIGGAVGALGSPIVNAIKGRPLFQDAGKMAQQNAEDTGQFGYQIGRAGGAAAPLGVLGRIPSAVLGVAQGVQGGEDVYHGIKDKDFTRGALGGLELATSALALGNLPKNKGWLVNPEVTGPIKETLSRKLPIFGKVREGLQRLSGLDKTQENTLDPSKKSETYFAKQEKAGAKGVEEKRLLAYEAVKEKTQSNRARYEFYKKKAEQAFDPNKPTPLELAGERAEEAVNTIHSKIQKLGEVKRSIMDADGAKPTSGVKDVRGAFDALLEERLGVQAVQDPETGAMSFESAPGRVSKIQFNSADTSLLEKAYSQLTQLADDASLQQVDDAVDAIQAPVYQRKGVTAVPINDAVEGVVKQTVGQLNEVAKHAAGAKYRQINAKMSGLIDTRDALNKALGYEGSKGGSLMKRVFSPTDGGTKKLFNKVTDITGINLNEEAVLAKLAMEVAGDARQANLLEQLGLVTSIMKGNWASLIPSIFNKISGGKGQAVQSVLQNAAQKTQMTPKASPGGLPFVPVDRIRKD